MIYRCEICNKEYASYKSKWEHDKNYHKKEIVKVINIENCCSFCKKELSNSFSKKRHEEKCKARIESKTVIEKQQIIIEDLQKKLEKNRVRSFRRPNKIPAKNNIISKNQVNNNNNTTNNTTNNNTNNITIVDNSVGKNIIIINKPGTESVKDLNQKEIEMIFSEEFGGIFKLIEFLNFNERLKQNHSFCLDKINEAYVSVYNTNEHQIDVERKKYFLSDMIAHSTQKLELLYKMNYRNLNSQTRKIFEEKIEFLEGLITANYNDPLVQEHIRQLAIISHNKKNIVRKTWDEVLSHSKEDIIEYKNQLEKEKEKIESKPIIINTNNSIFDLLKTKSTLPEIYD